MKNNLGIWPFTTAIDDQGNFIAGQLVKYYNAGIGQTGWINILNTVILTYNKGLNGGSFGIYDGSTNGPQIVSLIATTTGLPEWEVKSVFDVVEKNVKLGKIESFWLTTGDIVQSSNILTNIVKPIAEATGTTIKTVTNTAGIDVQGVLIAAVVVAGIGLLAYASMNKKR